MMKKIVICLFAITMITSTSVSLAGIMVSPLVIDFLPNQQPRQDVTVTNMDKNNAYVKVTSYLVEHPGTKQEQTVRIYDPKKLGLLVSPSKLIIPPRQHRIVRIVQLSPHLNKDKIYRIIVTPVPNTLLSFHSKNNDGKPMGIRIIVAYAIMAIVRPHHINRKLEVKRQHKILLIDNKSNTNVIVKGGKQCVKQHCFHLPNRRMYAGNRWQVKLPFDKPITITIEYMNKEQQITV